MRHFIHSDLRQKLLTPKPPYIYSLFLEKDEIDNLGELLRKEQNGKIIEIEAELLSTEKELIEKFSHHFDFQKGFGRNWDAFYDCLKDEAWGAHEFLVIIILNSEKLLQHADQRDLIIFKEILEDTAKSWAQEIHEDKPWDRKSKSLHVLFHVLPVNKEEFLSKLGKSNLPEINTFNHGTADAEK